MTVRLASSLSALVLALGMAATPNLVQAETFQAWGHEFTVAGTSSAPPTIAAPTRYSGMPADIAGKPARNVDGTRLPARITTSATRR